MASGINQQVYSVSQYVSALQSAWLNESATLFQRRYYFNGSHAGFILYMTDTASSVNDVDKLRETMRNSKGAGKLPQPVGVCTRRQERRLADPAGLRDRGKDAFSNIKNCMQDDVVAAHPAPPQLLGTMPNSTGGFGHVTKAAAVFGCDEIEPLQAQLLSLNEWTGQEVVRFRPYQLPSNEAK